MKWKTAILVHNCTCFYRFGMTFWYDFLHEVRSVKKINIFQLRGNG